MRFHRRLFNFKGRKSPPPFCNFFQSYINFSAHIKNFSHHLGALSKAIILVLKSYECAFAIKKLVVPSFYDPVTTFQTYAVFISRFMEKQNYCTVNALGYLILGIPVVVVGFDPLQQCVLVQLTDFSRKPIAYHSPDVHIPPIFSRKLCNNDLLSLHISQMKIKIRTTIITMHIKLTFVVRYVAT